MWQLDPQERGLQTVEALVVAKLDVLALCPLAEVAQPAQAGSEHLVVVQTAPPSPSAPRFLLG